MITMDSAVPASFPRARISSDMRRLVSAFLQCSPSRREDLLAKAGAAMNRDPRVDPAFTDRLMASAGGAAAVYRQVIAVVDEMVHYTYSNRPFGRDKHSECTLKVWRKWAMRAVVERSPLIELYVPGYGWALHSELLDLALLLAIANDSPTLRVADSPTARLDDRILA